MFVYVKQKTQFVKSRFTEFSILEFLLVHQNRWVAIYKHQNKYEVKNI